MKATASLPLYQHKKRPEWGYAAVVETYDDRMTFGFDDGSSRTFLHRHLHLMSLAEPDEPEATEARNRIVKRWPPRPPVAVIPRARASKSTAKKPNAGRSRARKASARKKQ